MDRQFYSFNNNFTTTNKHSPQRREQEQNPGAFGSNPLIHNPISLSSTNPFQNPHFPQSPKNPDQYKKKSLPHHNKHQKKRKKHKKYKKPKPVEVFIHGLGPTATEEDLIELFAPFCRISNISFKRNKKTGKHRGFAFFTVPDLKIAKKLTKKAHYFQRRLVNCQIKVDNPDKKENRKRRLFVGQIPSDVSDWELVGVFAEFGEVRAAYMIRDYKGRPKNFGFVDYSSEAEVEHVLASRPIFVRGVELELKKFRKRGEEQYKEGDGGGEMEGDGRGSEFEGNEFEDFIGHFRFCQKFALRSLLEVGKRREFRGNTGKMYNGRNLNLKSNIVSEKMAEIFKKKAREKMAQFGLKF
jgi:RNA recognition motif-containing protein